VRKSAEPPGKLAILEAWQLFRDGEWEPAKRQRAEQYYELHREGVVRLVTTSIYRPERAAFGLVEAFETDPTVLESCRTANAEATARFERIVAKLGEQDS
jgi:hypothetical protein